MVVPAAPGSAGRAASSPVALPRSAARLSRPSQRTRGREGRTAMPGDRLRSLPARPSLRHLKLEAKRRLAAGEFATLHDAQAAIAREHGLPGWAALKQACAPESHAL